MRIKIHKRIDIDKSIGNMRIAAFNYAKPMKNSDEWEHCTEISCWYDRDCGNCPMSWEDRSYEGECNDCGCLFDYDFNVSTWKCMLPKWIKRMIAKRIKKKGECPC